jgi:16S rRNA (cytosine1407-C5)-methyltransferase
VRKMGKEGNEMVGVGKSAEWAKPLLSEKDYASLQAAMEQPLDQAIRLNQLKEAHLLPAWSERYGWETERVPFCPSGYWIRQSQQPPSTIIEHRLGYFYIQEAASMLPVELFDFEDLEAPLILDMAASPGGKTTHLTDRTADRGLIIANDASRSRIPALRVVMQNWGAINQAITCMPGERIGALLPDCFDAVLLDAPCSMQGLRTAESHAMRSVAAGEIASLAGRQVRLLESALRAARPGGQVVYATCTLIPQEDEGVLDHILGKFGDQIHLADVFDRLPGPAPALRSISGRDLDAQVSQALRIWPHLFQTAGFFCAKFIKDSPFPDGDYPARQPSTSVFLFNQAGDKAIARVTHEVQDQFGFDLAGLMGSQRLALSEFRGDHYLLPKDLMDRIHGLYFLSSGMLLGSRTEKGWMLSHEFTARFGNQFTDGIVILDEDRLPEWERGADIRGLHTTGDLNGKMVVVRDASGRYLGRGKLLANRLRNLLPTRLF